MKGEDKNTITITLKIENSNVTGFQGWLDQNYELISYKILPDTEKMYKNDETFKKLVKGVKTASRLRDDYIHKYNK